MKSDFTDITNESEAERLGGLYPIILSGYNSNYPQLYLQEKEYLQEIFGDSFLRISHIGSTAVIGLISKPTIDILVEVKKDTNFDEITNKLTCKGYIVNHPPNDIIMFIKGYGEKGFEGQAYHIHVREIGDYSEFYFRDYLISHPEKAKEYGELKQRLQQQFRNHRDGYTFAKSQFITEVTDLARCEFQNKYTITK